MSKKTVVTHYKVKLNNVVAPLRIALVSDIHERPPKDAAGLVESLSPDLIAIAGDTLERYSPEVQRELEEKHFSPIRRLLYPIAYYVNWFFMKIGRNKPSTEKTYDFLRRVSRVAPVVMSIGNHEQRFLPEDIELFERLHITLLDNSDTEFEINGQPLLFGGLSTFYDEKWLAAYASKDGLKILLCHHPSYYDALELGDKAALILAGHNHGGQIRLFNRGILSSGEGFLPKYDKGFFYDKLIVSAGCSNTVALPRLHNPREIVCIDIIK